MENKVPNATREKDIKADEVVDNHCRKETKLPDLNSVPTPGQTIPKSFMAIGTNALAKVGRIAPSAAEPAMTELNILEAIDRKQANILLLFSKEDKRSSWSGR